MRLSISGLARRDLRDALDFIAAENPAAAKALSHQIRDAGERLVRFPLLGRPHDTETRFFQVAGTSYGLIYRLHGDTVTILRVWHGARGWPSVS